MHIIYRFINAKAIVALFLASPALAEIDDDQDDDFLAGRSSEQIQALFDNLDEVIETIAVYATLASTLAILLGLAVFLRLPRWGAYVCLTMLSTIWFALLEQHLTGQFWISTWPEFSTLVLLGFALASLHMAVAATSILPNAPLHWARSLIAIGAVAIWFLLWMTGIPETVDLPALFYVAPLIALFSHAAAIPSFLRLQGATSGVTRNGAAFALIATTAGAVAILFGELTEEIDLVFLMRLGLVAVVVYFTIFFVRYVLALLYQRDTNARLAIEAAKREAEKTQALLEAEKNYSRAREAARLHTLRLAEASHDIRQPIASLRSTMDAVAKDQTPETRAQLTAAFDYLDDLALSYLDTGTAANAPAPRAEDGRELIETQMIIATLDRMFRQEAEARGLTFSTSADDATLWVPPLMLIRTLSNLMSNAIKHTTSGGVHLSASRAENGFCFAVFNTSELPSGTDVNSLLNPYVKGEESKGSGLGLAIVDKLAKRFGWRLDCKSASGKGTTFSLTVPPN